MKYVHGGDIFEKEIELDFSVNTNPLGMPEKVIETAKAAVVCAEKYPDYSNRRLCNALGDAYGVPGKYIICANGAAALIYELLWAIRPKNAMVAVPTFLEYENALKAVKAEVWYHFLDETRGFAPGESLLLDIQEKKPEVLFLCNPNNPTGRLIPQNFLEKVLAVCEENKTRLVLDESFLGFTKGESAAGYLKEHKGLFLIGGFTKLFCMPGLRSGYGICWDEDFLERIHSSRQDWNLTTVSQEASIVALGEHKYMEETKKLIWQEREFLVKGLQKLGIRVYDSDANFLLFFCEKDLYAGCLARKILIRDCSNFTGLKKGFWRIAVRTHEENKKLLNVLGELIHG